MKGGTEERGRGRGREGKGKEGGGGGMAERWILVSKPPVYMFGHLWNGTILIFLTTT